MSTSAKDAVQKAVTVIQDFFPRAKDIRLEEIEPFGEDWNVVLSFKTEEPTTIAHVLGAETRLFKTITIASGEFHSMKVWKP